jgi:hypothetical protein
MRQQSLAAQASFEKYGRKSRPELFLDEMNKVVPWAELEALVAPHYARPATGAALSGLRSCCGRTSCSSGLTYPIRAWKRRCTTRRPRGASRA